MITVVFGYYWLLLKNYDAKTDQLITESFDQYLSGSDQSSSDQDLKLKKISEMLVRSGRTFIITRLSDKSEIPVFWNGLKDGSDPASEMKKFMLAENVTARIKTPYGEKVLYSPRQELIGLLKFYPFFLAGSIALTIFMTGYLYFFMRRNEKQSIWIAVSKETAHQLGTPLSSLSGWSEYLSELSKVNDDLSQVSEGIKEDIEKIALVTERFSKISSEKDFVMSNISAIIERSADYIARRITSDKEKLTIKKDLAPDINMYVNPVLIEWTVENLLKNSVEALQEGKRGEIEVRLFEEKEKAVIEVCDNGSGISVMDRKRVFETGFSTKKRGWGLGLSLSKKIIEQYHNGKLMLKKTGSEGTVFRIELEKFV
jgi:two-component system, sporulation sensor kinase D